MQLVYIRSLFRNKEDIDEAKAVTGYGAGEEESGEEWQAVCSPSTLDIISGWASIEDLALLKQLSSYEGSVVQAIYVSTIKEVVGGIKLRYFGMTHNVFNVLFVQNVDNDRFRRAGIGRLYSKEISQGFKEVVEREIELV